MEKLLVMVVLSMAALIAGQANAELSPAGSVENVPTRNVQLPIYTVWNKNAVATVILISGGEGGFGNIGANGWPDNHNLLVRSAPLFANQPLNIVVLGTATDMPRLGWTDRASDAHMEDIRSVLLATQAKSNAPIWLVGVSRGTVDAPAATLRFQGNLVAGLVLVASAVNEMPYNLLAQNIEDIRVPVLLIHHENDPCQICDPSLIEHAARRMVNSPAKRVVFIQGGSGSVGSNCGSYSWHGFPGREQEVVSIIAEWIKRPAN